VIVRNRPDIVAQWSDVEVARRWLAVYPTRKNVHGEAEEPKAEEIRMITSDAERLSELRMRLSSISWFMRNIAEPIARRANKEEECTGRFWEGRYKCQRLLDEAAVLACSVYVDLNPVRAGIAKTPEGSEFTSAYERIRGKQNDQARMTNDQRKRLTDRKRLAPIVPRDGWLSPVELHEKEGESQAAQRASNKGFLSMKLQQYLELLDWTGRQVRGNKRGAIPSELAPILDRLGIAGDAWVETVTNFGRWFHRAVGNSKRLGEFANGHDQSWLTGVSRGRTAFA